MKIRIAKVQDGKWNVVLNGEVVSTATRSFMYGDSYEAELPNGKVIYAVSQDALKRMVLKYI